MNHADHLRLALDGRAVQREDYVMLFNARLAGWSVLGDRRPLDALFFFQFESTPSVARDVRDAPPKPGAGFGLLAGENQWLARLIHRPVLCSVGKTEK